MSTKTITAEQALARLQRLCSMREKCTADILKKLAEYQIEPDEVDIIIQKLQASGFIDDERFARSFARTKHKISKWGKQKIAFNLSLKRISKPMIDMALSEISTESNSKIINAELQKKLQRTKAKSKAALAAKLLQFAVSRGYDYSESYEIIKGLIQEIDEI